MYDHILFDLYGTLVDVKTDQNKRTLWQQMPLIYGYYGAVYTPQELRREYRRLTAQKTEEIVRRRPEIRYPEIELREVFADLFRLRDVEPTPDMVTEAAHAFRAISTNHLRLFEGTKEMLFSLKNAGKKVYLLSNAQSCFTRPELKYLGLEEFFDAVYLSSDYGCRKPDTAFYHQLLDREQPELNRSVMVGNDYLCDICAAREVGLDTLYIVSPQTPKDDPYETSTYMLEKMDMKRVQETLLKGQ